MVSVWWWCRICFGFDGGGDGSGFVLVVVVTNLCCAWRLYSWCRRFGFWCLWRWCCAGDGAVLHSQVMGLMYLCYFTTCVFVTTPKSGCGTVVTLFIFPLPFKKTTAESQPLSKTYLLRDFGPLRRGLFFVFGV
jgi:hypothetical protein